MSSRLAQVSRIGLLVAAAAFGVLGVIAFVQPQWASEHFPWKVGPFAAMTIAGWSIGVALIALDAARTWDAPRVYPMLVFLWMFGLGQALVLVAFLDKLLPAATLAPLYLAGLAALLVSAGTGLLYAWRARPRLRAGPRAGRAAIAGNAVFVLFVGLLVVATLITPQGGGATEGRFVPEKMTLFTVRAFCAFFASLAIAAASLFLTNNLRAYLDLALAGQFLIVPITIAALVNLSLFDFSARPGSLLYLAAYVVVGAVLAVVLVAYRLRDRRGRST